MKVSDIVSIENQLGENLQVLEEKSSHPLHANIYNLPSNERAKEKEVALIIAKNTNLIMKPE